MSRPRRIVACLTASLLLAAPSAALAQSAGDDQYSDPLAGNTTNAQSTTPSAKTPPSSGLGQTPPSDSGSSSSGSGSGSSAGGSGSSSSSSSATATTPRTATSSSTLPNTGFDARLVAALGAAMLLGGAGLRLRARGADR